MSKRLPVRGEHESEWQSLGVRIRNLSASRASDVAVFWLARLHDYYVPLASGREAKELPATPDLVVPAYSTDLYFEALSAAATPADAVPPGDAPSRLARLSIEQVLTVRSAGATVWLPKLSHVLLMLSGTVGHSQAELDLQLVELGGPLDA